MDRRKIKSSALVDDWNREQFRQCDQRRYGFGIAPKRIGDDDRRLRVDQHLGRFAQRFRICLHRRRRRITVHIRYIERALESIFLNIGIVIDVHRRGRIRRRNPVAADKGIRYIRQRIRLIVPFSVIAHLIALDERGVDPVDARAAPLGVHRPRAAEHHHRHAVDIGVEDRHAGVLQSDHVVANSDHRFVLGLGVAVGHCNGDFFMMAEDHFGLIIAAVVDD